MKNITSLIREEDGAAEMLQVIILLGFAAMIVTFLIATSLTVETWGKGRMEVILQDEVPQDVDGEFTPPDWTDPSHY